MITRRSLLGGILACAAAPAIVRAEILMPVRKIIVPDFEAAFQQAMLDAVRYGTGIMDTTAYTGQRWAHGLVGSPEYRAAQRAMNVEMRRLMDNLGPTPRFQTVIGGERRYDVDARLNAAWTA